MLRLIEIFENDFEFFLDLKDSTERRQIACACIAATNDEGFSHPIIDGKNGGEITWPKSKLREWLRAGEKAQELHG